MNRTFIAAMLAVVALTTGAQAVITELDSTSFLHKYEANDLPTVEDTGSGLTNWAFFDHPSVDAGFQASGGTLSYSTMAYDSGGEWFYSNASVPGSAWVSEVTTDGSFTVDFRVKTTESKGDVPGFHFIVDNGNDRSWINVATDHVGYGAGNSEQLVLVDAVDNASNFHDYRLTFYGDAGLFFVWRDGALIGDALSAATTAVHTSYIGFGDATSRGFGAAEIDHVRWDATGAYMPVGGDQPSDVVKPSYPDDVAGGPVIDGGTVPYAWYRADEGVATWTGEGVDGKVEYWADQSGNNRHLTAGGDPQASAECPNGAESITFDGNDYFLGTADEWGTPAAGTVFAVYRRNGEGGGNAGLFLYDAAIGGGPRQFYLIVQDGRYGEGDFIEAGGTDSEGTTHYPTGGAIPDPVGLDGWAVSSISHTSGLMDTLRINGEDVYTGDFLSGGMQGIRLGSYINDANFSWDGEICELIVFEGDLSPTERAAIEDELMLRWGLSGGTGLEGDLNGDGAVNSGDLDIVRANWGQSVDPGCLLCGDPSGDGQVGSADLDVVRANWGATAAATVPEPGLLLLVLVGFVATATVRRR